MDTSAQYPLPRGTAPGAAPPQLPEFVPPPTAPERSPERSPQRPGERQSLFRRIGGSLLAALLLLAKFGKAALLLVGKGKFLVTAGSMLVSIAAAMPTAIPSRTPMPRQRKERSAKPRR